MIVETKVRIYLQQFERALRGLPESERQDALREIGSHLEDQLAAGTDVDIALARLGQPDTLAKFYLATYHLERLSGSSRTAAPSLPSVLPAMAFFASASLGGLFVIPVLALFLFVFSLIAVVLPIAGIARAFGAPWALITGPGGPVPIGWAIPLTIAVGLVSAAIAWGCLWLLRLYITLTSKVYRKWIATARPPTAVADQAAHT